MNNNEDNSLNNYMYEKNLQKVEPLAYRIRPKKLEDILGQNDILDKNKILYKMIKNDILSSIIFYGPPGSGKTTISRVIANTTKANFCQINATNSSKKEMEDIIDFAKKEIGLKNKKTILFIDEIHRFNKAQQDYLLPFVENGTIIFIGATTENPYFEVNNALLSRSKIFELKPLSPNDIKIIIDKTINDDEYGLGSLNIKIDDEAKNFLSEFCNGDARIAINTIEIASRTTDKQKDGCIHINIDIVKDCLGKHGFFYDKNGDNHYDVISAFIKSMRGSDPNATLYYLARMLKAGEDIKFIARRIMICASEDVGLADPMAIVVATNCANAIEKVGMPESNLILAEAALYVSKAKKSNLCCSIYDAEEIVEKTGNLDVPSYLKGTGYKGAKELGRGIGYKYPHDYKGHYVEQQYLPERIKNLKLIDFSELDNL